MLLELILLGGGYVAIRAAAYRAGIVGISFQGVKKTLSLQSGELIPGVQKPSTVLAEMMALKILEKPQILLPLRRSADSRLYDFVFQSDKGWQVFYDTSYGLVVEKCPVNFDDKEINIIRAAMKKSVELKKELDKAKAAERNQEQAIRAIELWMGVDKKSS